MTHELAICLVRNDGVLAAINRMGQGEGDSGAGNQGKRHRSREGKPHTVKGTVASESWMPKAVGNVVHRYTVSDDIGATPTGSLIPHVPHESLTHSQG